jgi:ribosomal protein S21
MAAAIEPLKTQIREADQGRAGIALAGVRQRMAPRGSLAAALERPRQAELAKSRRAAHAVVVVENGEIEFALRLLKRKLNDAVLAPTLKRLAVPTMNGRDKYKVVRAEARRLKAASRRRRRAEEND